MKSIGTQTEQNHLSNDHARVDLDESFESLTTTTSEASEWTPPETDENNNLDNQVYPPSHHSKKFIVTGSAFPVLYHLWEKMRP